MPAMNASIAFLSEKLHRGCILARHATFPTVNDDEYIHEGVWGLLRLLYQSHGAGTHCTMVERAIMVLLDG